MSTLPQISFEALEAWPIAGPWQLSALRADKQSDLAS